MRTAGIAAVGETKSGGDWPGKDSETKIPAAKAVAFKTHTSIASRIKTHPGAGAPHTKAVARSGESSIVVGLQVSLRRPRGYNFRVGKPYDSSIAETG